MYCTPDVIVLTRTNRCFLSRSSEWRGQHFLLAEEMALPPLSSSSTFFIFFSSLLFFFFPRNSPCWSQRSSSDQGGVSTWYCLLLWLLGCTMKQTTKAKQMRQAWKKDTNKQAKVPEEKREQMYKLRITFPGSGRPARVQSRNQGILCG